MPLRIVGAGQQVKLAWLAYAESACLDQRILPQL
jgi:hypothetical protein